MLGVTPGEDWIDRDSAHETVSNIAKTFIEYHKNVPISFIEIWETDNGVGEIAIATDPKYRSTGATSKNIRKAILWFESNKNTNISELQWNNLIENKKSADVAERYGFDVVKTSDGRQFRSRFK